MSAVRKPFKPTRLRDWFCLAIQPVWFGFVSLAIAGMGTTSKGNGFMPSANLQQIQNPLTALESAKKIAALPKETKLELRNLLLELSKEALAKAEYSWKKRKAPMAAYWKAVSVYARHIARLLAK